VEARIEGIFFFIHAIIALIILSFRVLCFFGLIFDANSALLNSDTNNMVSLISHSEKFGQHLVGEIGHIYEGCPERKAPHFFLIPE